MAKKVNKATAKKVIKETIGKLLNDKQKLFCVLYVSDKYCFGNATKSYTEAYDLSKEQYDTARQNGYRLLTNAYIRKYIDKMLDDQLEEVAVDRELAKLVKQDKDLRSKVAAIAEYNKLKSRITEKHDITSDGDPIATINYLLPNGHNDKTDVKTA